MTNINYQAMSKAELRAYVLEHLDDREAFYELSDRIRANGKRVTVEELEQILKQRQ